ncbi:unnamed protein product, partial [Staurois parvus]
NGVTVIRDSGIGVVVIRDTVICDAVIRNTVVTGSTGLVTLYCCYGDQIQRLVALRYSARDQRCPMTR